MFAMKLVGLTLATFTTREEAIEAFRKAEEKGSGYGNRYVKCPDGSTINCWDL